MKNSSHSYPAISLKAMRNRQGFTLIELVMAIGIGAIMLAIAIPSFENLVYKSSANRVTLELVGALQNARLKAIKTHQDVIVTFNDPGPDQFTVRWTENGPRTVVHDLAEHADRVTFDNAPPAATFPPDNSFTFNNMGFVEPDMGNTTGNIYIVDNVNGRRFHISTTIAGGFVESRYEVGGGGGGGGGGWVGPDSPANPTNPAGPTS